MKLSRREIEDIRGLIYLAKKAPHDERSQRFTEISERISEMLSGFERRKRLHLEPVRLALVVLLKLLRNGHVNIVSVEDRNAYTWAIERLEHFTEHPDEL